MSYRLANGREVYLDCWIMVGTYAGALCGSPATLSPGLRQHVATWAADLLPPAQPLVAIEAPAGELPDWFCVARLRSLQGARTTDPDYASRLYVCWFTGDTSQRLDAMIEALLPHLDWERRAEDYDVCW
jgi:hypothetical protein